MTDQDTSMQDILQARLAFVQDLSAANAEHLRLTQIRRGFEVLEMGGETENLAAKQGDNRAALAACEARIAGLEDQVARLDRKLEAIVKGGE